MGLTFDGHNLVLDPPRYPSEEVKLELGGRWDKDEKVWRLAPTSLNVLTLMEWYGEQILDTAPQEVQDLALEAWGFRGFTPKEREQASKHTHWNELYEHQREGVEYCFCNPHGAALMNLSWGMGKGAVSVVTTDLLEAEKILVLAPLTLAPAWRGEFKRWSERELEIKRAVPGDREPGSQVTIANHEMIQETILRDEDGNVVQDDLIWKHLEKLDELEGLPERIETMIQNALEDERDWTTNKQLVKLWIENGPKKTDSKGKKVPVRERITRIRRDYLNIEWDLIIVDESVLLKNRKAVKVDVLGQLRKASDPIILELSGSPITKYRNDLHPQLKILLPRAFGAYWRFTEFFCVVDKSGWGWTIEGDRPDRDPQHYLRDLLWVKSQDDALPDLPKYIEKHLTIEANDRQRGAIDQMLKDWIVELEDAPNEKVEAKNWLARMTRLQQLTSNVGSLPRPSGKGFFPRDSAKEDTLVKLIDEGDVKTPLLVWTWYVETTHSVVERLEKEFPELRVGYVIGELSRDQKDETIQAYKDGELDVLVMQMSTGKFGHTFTDTRTIYYHDRAFDSDAYVQSLHRVRRIGLKHRPILIVPKIEMSADELIDLNLEGKLGSMARLTNANLVELLKSIKPS